MLASLPFTAFTDLLTTRLSQPLPGQSAQFQMAPLARRQPEMASVEAKTCREAGVMALFYPDAERQPQLLLTRRPDAMKKHAGQIAFPGGRREAHESLEEAALRETEEEVLIPAARIDVIGALSSLYIPLQLLRPPVCRVHRLHAGPGRPDRRSGRGLRGSPAPARGSDVPGRGTAPGRRPGTYGASLPFWRAQGVGSHGHDDGRIGRRPGPRCPGVGIADLSNPQCPGFAVDPGEPTNRAGRWHP